MRFCNPEKEEEEEEGSPSSPKAMQSKDLLVGKGSPEVAPVAPKLCNPRICWLAKVAAR